MAEQIECKKVVIYLFINFHVARLTVTGIGTKYQEKGLVSKQKSFIYSIYLTDSCFAVRPRKLNHRLNKNAIPSVFPGFPKHLQKLNKKGNLQKEQLLSQK